MASSPAYADTPHVGAALVNNSTADTSYSSAPSHGSMLLTAGVYGTKVTEIDLIPAATIAAVVVTIWLYDGTNYHFFTAVTFAAVTLSTTAGPSVTPLYFDNLSIPAGWSLYVTETVASQPVQVNAFGADL
jgi:hypothetical protein